MGSAVIRLGRGAALAVAALLVASPAHAEAGITFGPARQLVPVGQSTAVVRIANPSDEPMVVMASEWVMVRGEWQESEVAVIGAPVDPIRLKPGAQRDVSIGVNPSARPCRFVGVGFGVLTDRADGVVVRGVGLAQLALQGSGGTEADCLALLPQPEPTAAAGFPWWLLVVPVGCLLGAGVLVRRSRRA